MCGRFLTVTGLVLIAALPGRCADPGEIAVREIIVEATGAVAEAPVVYVIPLEGEVELGLTSMIARGFREAVEMGSSYVVVDMSTPGGRVDAALEICDLLLECSIPTAVLVSGDATSAGAIIAICTEKIYMTPGSTIGTAAPITIGEGGQANPAGEKAVSYIRAKVREYANQRGRDPDICQAMIDADLRVEREIDGEMAVISEEGELLTLTSGEALRFGFIDGIIEDDRSRVPSAEERSSMLPEEFLEALDMVGGHGRPATHQTFRAYRPFRFEHGGLGSTTDTRPAGDFRGDTDAGIRSAGHTRHYLHSLGLLGPFHRSTCRMGGAITLLHRHYLADRGDFCYSGIRLCGNDGPHMRDAQSGCNADGTRAIQPSFSADSVV